MKNILIGVTGSIAAYKSLEIVNQLSKDGYNVHVVMTRSACEFVTPLSFKVLSSNPVAVEVFDSAGNWDVEHIELAKQADLFVIAPATANIIGKLANGIADDMLTTIALATTCPVLIFPAMNTNMLYNPIVQDNIEKLRRSNFQVYKTGSGELACGDFGDGKLLPWDEIVDIIKTFPEK